MLVYVINKDGKPLMPCSCAKARRLIMQKRAIIYCRDPFTIKLVYGSSGYIQETSLGIDAGSKVVGISVTTEKREIFAAEAILRNDIVGLIADRAKNRSNRRARKTRYRKARFKNRKKSIGWVAPSIRHKIDSHIKLVNMLRKILPVSKIVVEIASFDIQKLNNPNISGSEYQKGEQYGFSNVREYVLFRDKHKCQGRKDCSNNILNVHHIESRKTGGNSPGNLITLCKECHKDYHNGILRLEINRKPSLRDATFMGIMRERLCGELKGMFNNTFVTYGYITKQDRINNGISKSHVNDALCISGNLNAVCLNYIYHMKFVRKHNRKIHKNNFIKGGKRKMNQSSYNIKGYRLFDKVKFNGTVCFIFGKRSSGYFDLRTIDGQLIHASASFKKLQLLSHRKTLLVEQGRRHKNINEIIQ